MRATAYVSSTKITDQPARAVRRTVLPGGLRVVTEFVPGVHSASVGLWVGVGSRDEKPSVAGAAHFLEHLLFKSTPTRTAVGLAQEIDALGGELNAFTSKEHTCYYAHVIDSDLLTAIDMVADVVLRGQCREVDIDTERDVVLEEIAMRDDDSEDLLGDVFATAMFGDHPIGRPVLGTVETVSAMTRKQLRSFHSRRYTTDRMVLSVAGNIDHAQVVAAARSAFAGHLDRGVRPAPLRRGVKSIPGRPGFELINRDTEQAHLLLGMRCGGRTSSTRWPLAVLNTAIGGGLSSRLFQEIREQRGLAYSVYSSVDSFAEIGAFSVYAGAQPDRLGEVVRLTRDILNDVAAHGISDSELARAQGSLRGAMVLGLEDTGSRMHRLGRNEVQYGKNRSIDASLRKIAAVRASDVAMVAAEVLRSPMGGALIGPYRTRRDVPSVLRNMVR